jgi:NAD(P)-dependent dehydrogenase (short-subunit alcohol dehydrogenase family)
VFRKDLFSGRTIVVTGASSGLGRAVAISLSELGASCLLFGRNPERLSETLDSLSGSGHCKYELNLEDPSPLTGILREASKTSSIYGAFHAAGMEWIKPISILKADEVDKMMGPTLKTALILTSVLSKSTEGGGSLVMMSSVAATRGQTCMSLYSASRAAIEGAARSLAVELAPKNIRVNAIAAGAVETEMHDRIAKRSGAQSMDIYLGKHLLGFGRPKDIVDAALFLLSPEVRWITGTTMVVDGGYSAG